MSSTEMTQCKEIRAVLKGTLAKTVECQVILFGVACYFPANPVSAIQFQPIAFGKGCLPHSLIFCQSNSSWRKEWEFKQEVGALFLICIWWCCLLKLSSEVLAPPVSQNDNDMLMEKYSYWWKCVPVRFCLMNADENDILPFWKDVSGVKRVGLTEAFPEATLLQDRA